MNVSALSLNELICLGLSLEEISVACMNNKAPTRINAQVGLSAQQQLNALRAGILSENDIVLGHLLIISVIRAALR